MRALTICQPYAHLIMLPKTHPEMKRVENRVWSTTYRGPLLIHAGKSRDWLSIEKDVEGNEYDDEYDVRLSEMAFGAIVGAAFMEGCVSIEDIRAGKAPRFWSLSGAAFRWLKDHQHSEGPFCFALHTIRPFKTPIPYKGAQGFFNVPDEVVAEQLAASVSPGASGGGK